MKETKIYILILLGSLLYAIGTVFFIFPASLLLGGTSGISVILNTYLPYSPGKIFICINIMLLFVAFIILGKNMAVKTLVGSFLTTVFVGILDNISNSHILFIPNRFFSAILGAGIIALASGIMFYVESSSGGTDIIALIVKKYFRINIGRALLITDFFIVLVGGILSNYVIAMCSMVGLLIKTFGIDFVIYTINKITSNEVAQ